MDIQTNFGQRSWPVWAAIEDQLAKEDFAKKLFGLYRVLESYGEEVLFWFVRNDGRLSLTLRVSRDYMDVLNPSELYDGLRDVADRYQRGMATPLSTEQKDRLGRLFQEAWRAQAPILFSVIEEEQLSAMRVIDHLANMFEYLADDPRRAVDKELAEYCKYASISDIREAVRSYFPDGLYDASGQVP